MKKLALQTRHDPVPYRSYVTGFVLSIIATLVAYVFVKANLLSMDLLIYVVMGIAVVQLIVQVVFFLHIGRGTRLKLITFVFTLLVVGILVVGSIWVMNHLNYNMMDMTPSEQRQYMSEHEGI